ncbi:hypothetical protein BC829DRAFT_422055 [Chytridium lagenaria]|nr:hypothetical protein BC829DRAFT_422055 [Chytridium lagenaria]
MSSESIQDNTEETIGRMVRKRQRIMDYFVVADNATRSDTASASASAASIGPPHIKAREEGRNEKRIQSQSRRCKKKNAGRPAGGSKPVQKAATSSDLPTDDEDEIPLVRNQRKRLPSSVEVSFQRPLHEKNTKESQKEHVYYL